MVDDALFTEDADLLLEPGQCDTCGWLNDDSKHLCGGCGINVETGELPTLDAFVPLRWDPRWRLVVAGASSLVIIATIALVYLHLTTANRAFTRGQTALAANDQQAAATAFQEAVVADPQHARALAALANVKRLLADPEGAEELAQRSLKLAPERNAAAHLVLGDAALRRQEFATAKTHLELAMRASPAQSDATYLLADVCAQQGDLARAVTLYKEALRVAPLSPMAGESRLKLAEVYIERRQFKQALAELGQAHKRGASTTLVQITYGKLHLSRNEPGSNDLQLALDAFTEASESTDSSPIEIWRGLATCAHRQNQRPIALGHIDRGLQLAPKDKTLLLLKGQVLHEMGNADAARTLYKSLLADVPTDGEVQLRLGELDFKGGKLDSAERYFLAAAEIPATQARARRSLANLKLRQGKPAAAALVLDQAWQAADHAPELGYHLAAAWIEAKDENRAIVVLERVVQDDVAFGGAREKLIDLYAKTDQPVRAIAHLEVLCEQQPMAYDRHHQWASLLIDQELRAKAAVVLRELLERNPNDAEAQRLLRTLQ